MTEAPLSAEAMSSDELMALDHTLWATIEERMLIVDLARSWLGTPYHHQASLRGAGADCLGLLRGVWRSFYAEGDAAKPPSYSKDWAEATKEETLLSAANTHLCAIPLEIADVGDVVIFRYKQKYTAKHAVILTTPDKMIHAAEFVGVCEVHVNDWWWRRAAGAYRFKTLQRA